MNMSYQHAYTKSLIGLFIVVIFYLSSCYAARFDHQLTNFPLDGQHSALECQDCHQNGLFKGTPTQCELCHSDSGSLDATAKSFNHMTTGNQCADCHTTQNWTSIIRVDHQSLSGQ